MFITRKQQKLQLQQSISAYLFPLQQQNNPELSLGRVFLQLSAESIFKSEKNKCEMKAYIILKNIMYYLESKFNNAMYVYVHLNM